MSTVYLHIGTPKTGTSAIQAFLGIDQNRTALENHGFSFPLFRDFKSEDQAVHVRNAHSLIFGVYLSHSNYEDHADIREEFWEKVRELLDSGKNVILSDESIWHVSLKIDGFFENIYKRVQDMGHELKIVVYLRRQDKVLQSYWRYKVMIARRHMQASFKSYLDGEKYMYFPLDYFERLSQIADDIGGTDKIIVRVYEHEQFYGEEPTIVSDFLHCIGLELTEDYVQADIKRNSGIDFACCEVKRRLNAFESVQNSDFLREYLVEISEKNKETKRFQTPSIFNKEDHEKFMNRYEESNRQTAKVFMHREDGKLFCEPVKYAKSDPEELLSEKDRLLICTEVMEQMEKKINKLQKELKKAESPSWKKIFHMAGARIRGKNK